MYDAYAQSIFALFPVDVCDAKSRTYKVENDGWKVGLGLREALHDFALQEDLKELAILVSRGRIVRLAAGTRALSSCLSLFFV